jgi:hypothetical protein
VGDTLKVTRNRITPAMRLAALDASIERTEKHLQDLREKRAALVSETKKVTADLLAQVGG